MTPVTSDEGQMTIYLIPRGIGVSSRLPLAGGGGGYIPLSNFRISGSGRRRSKTQGVGSKVGSLKAFLNRSHVGSSSVSRSKLSLFAVSAAETRLKTPEKLNSPEVLLEG